MMGWQNIIIINYFTCQATTSSPSFKAITFIVGHAHSSKTLWYAGICEVVCNNGREREGEREGGRERGREGEREGGREEGGGEGRKTSTKSSQSVHVHNCKCMDIRIIMNTELTSTRLLI